MNARMPKPAEGEAKVVTLPVGEASPTSAAPPAPAEAPAAAPAKPKRSRQLLLMVSLPLLLVIGGGYFWVSGGRYVDTDNAYVQQAKVAISSDVAGRIMSVAVHENQTVAAGDTLFTIDPEPYRIALSQAEAALAAAKVNVEQLRVAYSVSNAKLDAAKSALDLRQAEFDRKQTLTQKGIAADSTMDDIRLTLQQAQTAVALAEQDLANAAAALGGDPNIATEDHPAVQSAMAARDTAQRNLSKTTVVAPGAGIVSQVSSLNVGQFIATGTTIASLVETSDTWISANFKETQLSDMRDGQPVEISIDAYPGKIEGKIASIGAATGSEFSLIPAQNATGNWVKVVQRVPVRIEFDDGSDLSLLRTGMSATVAVDTGHSTLDKLLGK
jgi:membrane fusion protein (multidrug efflux system)